MGSRPSLFQHRVDEKLYQSNNEGVVKALLELEPA